MPSIFLQMRAHVQRLAGAVANIGRAVDIKNCAHDLCFILLCEEIIGLTLTHYRSSNPEVYGLMRNMSHLSSKV